MQLLVAGLDELLSSSSGSENNLLNASVLLAEVLCCCMLPETRGESGGTFIIHFHHRQSRSPLISTLDPLTAAELDGPESGF